MIVQGTPPRGLSTAGRLCVVVLACVLLPLVPVLARQEPKSADVPKAEAKPVAAASLAEEPDEPIHFAQGAKELPAAAGQIWSVALSPDGKTLAVLGGGRLRLLDLKDATFRPDVGWDYQGGHQSCLAFSPDGKLIATGSGGSLHTNTVYLWNVPPRKKPRD